MSDELVRTDALPVSPALARVRSVADAAPAMLLSATNDREAIAIWLRARAARSPNTLEAYSRAASNFLLWVRERGLAGLADLTVEHAQAYLDHLASPPEHWIRPTHRPAHDMPLLQTQVLMGPASASSIAWHRTVIAQMLGYLSDTRYLPGNAMKLTARLVADGGLVDSKALSLRDWTWLKGWLDCRGDEDPLATRDRWIVTFLYHTGLRREEAAAACGKDLVRDDTGWALRVIGKGRKERFVTLNSAVLAAMRAYRSSLGLPDSPGPADTTPLIVRMRRNARFGALHPRSIGRITARLLERAAGECDDPRTQAALLAASTHTLRHTNASHRLAAGADIETTQDELGHADINTTRSYSHTEKRKRRQDAERLGSLAESGPAP